MHVHVALIVAAYLVGASPTPAPVKLAAPGLTYANIDEKTGEFFLDSLSQQLIKQGIHVSTQKEISAVVDNERQKSLLGCNDKSDCLTELAGALGVDGIVTGSIAKISAGFAVNIKIIAATDSRMLSAQTARVKDDAALLDWFESAAARMANDVRTALGRGGSDAARHVPLPEGAPGGESKNVQVSDASSDPAMVKPTIKDTEPATHEVEWGGKWFPARVLNERKDGFLLIHYVGYSASWDEWVAPSRLRKLAPPPPKPPPDPNVIEVEWKGSWYPARILEKRGDGFAYIHYENYGDNWNEWVPPKRMRAKKDR